MRITTNSGVECKNFDCACHVVTSNEGIKITLAPHKASGSSVQIDADAKSIQINADKITCTGGVDALNVETTALDEYNAIKAAMRLSDVKAVETLFDCVQLMDKENAKEANGELMRIIRLSLTVCQTRPELQRLGKLIARAQLFAIRENFTRDEITAALLPDSTKTA